MRAADVSSETFADASCCVPSAPATGVTVIAAIGQPRPRYAAGVRITQATTLVSVPSAEVIVNDVPTFRVDHMPYGGVKDSGLGREGIRYAMEEMTERKLLVMRA